MATGSLKIERKVRRPTSGHYDQSFMRRESQPYPLFTGRPHRDYARYHAQLDPIVSTIFPNWTRKSAATEIAPLAKIPRTTLYQWKEQWEEDSSWRPWAPEGRGAHHRIFTDDQETDIVDEIIIQHILPGRIFNAHDFRLLAMRKFLELGGESDQFQCSDHFIYDFKKRHRLSSRRFHMRRRNNQTDRPDIEGWLDEMQNLLATTHPDRIINCEKRRRGT
jgi:hypothetical protein